MFLPSWMCLQVRAAAFPTSRRTVNAFLLPLPFSGRDGRGRGGGEKAGPASVMTAPEGDPRADRASDSRAPALKAEDSGNSLPGCVNRVCLARRRAPWRVVGDAEQLDFPKVELESPARPRVARVFLCRCCNNRLVSKKDFCVKSTTIRLVGRHLRPFVRIIDRNSAVRIDFRALDRFPILMLPLTHPSPSGCFSPSALKTAGQVCRR
jgi:hypothetical protein